MSLGIDFGFGRLLQAGEKLTTARINAIVRGITANITGLVGSSDLAAGAVIASKVTPDTYSFANNCVLLGSTYTITGFPVNPPALTPGMVLSFKADQINTGAVSLTVNALPTYTLTKYGGKALVAGDIQSGQVVMVQLTDALLAQPTWEMVSLPGNQIVANQQPVLGSARNLIVQSGPTPALQVAATADELVLKDASGLVYLASAVNLTGNITLAGVNGLDTGSVAATTWYYVWVIYNATSNTLSMLFSLSATAPTLPAGYTFKAMVGAVHAGIPGGSTTNLMNFYQADRDGWIDESPAFTGKTGVTAWTAISGADLTAFQALVPPIAKAAFGGMGCSANNNGGMGVAGDANALGACSVNGTPIAATTQSFTLAGTWSVPLPVAQTVYYIMANTTAATYRLTVRGYRL